MLRRVLLGPVDRTWAEDHLKQWLDDDQLVVWGDSTPALLSLQTTKSWKAVEAVLPSGWKPDVLVFILASALPAPEWIWDAPVPVIALILNEEGRWHRVRRFLSRFDMVWATPSLASATRQLPVPIVEEVRWYGVERMLPMVEPRDIDVLWVGIPHAEEKQSFFPLLTPLARLRDRFNVVLHFDPTTASCTNLMRQAKVVILSECAAAPSFALQSFACGALPFLATPLDRDATTFCPSIWLDDLEPQIRAILDGDARLTHLEKLRQRFLSMTWYDHWTDAIASIDKHWPELTLRAKERPERMAAPTWNERVWQHLHSGARDPHLIRHLAARAAAPSSDSQSHYLLGIVLATEAVQRAPLDEVVLSAVLEELRRAVAKDSSHLLARLALVHVFLDLGDKSQATEQAMQALAVAESVMSPGTVCDSPLPFGAEDLRADWEHAAIKHSGNPWHEATEKVRLLRTRLHLLLAELSGELSHYYEAALTSPETPSVRAALGCALGRAGKPSLALSHLRAAVECDPLDRGAARALASAYRETGNLLGQRRVRRDCWLLLQAAGSQLAPADDWFANASPSGDEGASIIVVCRDSIELARSCIESIVRCTRRPFELILIDSGSPKETHCYLQDLCEKVAPSTFATRIKFVRSEQTLGDSAAINRGLADAQERYLVILRSDIVVTEGWLDRLVEWSLHDWPNVGIVGPTTNAAFGQQRIAVDYDHVDGLSSFADRRAQSHLGQAATTERLESCCLLVRREVLDRIGLLDERFTLGTFEGDDLCVRARRAGFNSLIALDVFVHQFGQVDASTRADSFRKFREKWGDDQAVRYMSDDHAPATIEVSLPHEKAAETWFGGSLETTAWAHSERPKVSLCMIVRNEEHHLPACLSSIADTMCAIGGEIVIVDTGSTDRTKEIAHQFGARVYDLPWPDSFAAARNESLHHARGEWIFWLDADDRLDTENAGKLLSLFKQLSDRNVGYSLKCVCLPDHVTGTVTVVDHLRVFRNDSRIRWRYRVHEQILMAIRDAGGEVVWSDIVIQHVGYQDPDRRGPKLQRDLRLLDLENAEHPDDPFTLFNLGWTFHELGRYADALPSLRQSLARSQPTDSIVRKIYSLLLHCYLALGQTKEALTVCREGRMYYPDDAELLFEEATLLFSHQQFAAAESCLIQLVEGQARPHFASVDAGLRGYKARSLLGSICHAQERFQEAAHYWQQVLAEKADHAPALLGLAELHLAQADWTALEGICQRLRSLPNGRLEAEVIFARSQLARREFREALESIDTVCREHVEAIWPRVIRSHVLLQEGRDLDAAERALQDILRLHPEHEPSRHNLAVLQEKRQQKQRH